MKVKFIVPVCIALIASTAFAQTPDNPLAENLTPVTHTVSAKNSSDGLDWHQVGIGFSTAVGNLFYIPAKITYATLGGVAGGAAYIFTRGEHRAAHDIWQNSFGGDYVLTPAMLEGQEPIHFVDVRSGNPELMANSLARQNTGPAQLVVSGKEPSQGTLAKTFVGEPRNTASDPGQQISAPNVLETKPAKLDNQRGNAVRRSNPAVFSAQPLNQERVPQFSIVPRVAGTIIGDLNRSASRRPRPSSRVEKTNGRPNANH
jgi:hypothetical protein